MRIPRITRDVILGTSFIVRDIFVPKASMRIAIVCSHGCVLAILAIPSNAIHGSLHMRNDHMTITDCWT